MASELFVDKITGKTGTSGGAPITLSGDTATLGSAVTFPTGMIVNVQQAVKLGAETITSQSYVIISGLTVTTATPKSSSSKFLIEYHIAASILDDTNHGYLQIYKGGSALSGATADNSGTDSIGSRTGATQVVNQSGAADGSTFSYGMKFLDSPSSSTAVTYAIYGKTSNSNGSLYINRSGRDNNDPTYDGRSISTLTIMEIAG